MNYLKFKKQLGVGLIEVLITTVVIAIGLLAVGALQSGFVSSSGDSKTRSEALILAEEKIEEFRNNVELGELANSAKNECVDENIGVDGFIGVCTPAVSAGYPEVIVGANSSFIRTWTVTVGGTADRKNISVSVNWGNGANEKVNVVTEMTFIDPSKSALLASEVGGGTGAVPSPRQNASEDVDPASESVVGTNLDIVANAGVTGTAGTSTDLTVDLPDSGGTLIIYQVASGSHFYTATTTGLSSIEAGVIAVFLCDDADDNNLTPDTCTHIQNHFGGVVNRIIGTVYSTSGNGLGNIQVAWTSSDVDACFVGTPVRTPLTGTLLYDSVPYECVNAGNCNATSAGTRTAFGTDATDPGCFVDAVVSDTQINDRNVGPGGEFGEVGLLGLDFQGGGQEQVCFLEDTADPATSPLINSSGSIVLNENYLFAVTKRLYLTRRVQRNDAGTVLTTGDDFNDHKSEGSNRSYSNHNFFIIERGNGVSARAKCHNEVTGIAKQIAGREISRALNEGTSNAVAAESSYSGGTSTAHVLTGNVTASATKLRLFIPETGVCYLNNAQDRTTDATGYACVVASDATSVEIVGSSNQHKSSDPSVFASCTRAANTTPGCHWLTDFTATFNDGVGSSSCSTPWGANLANAASVDAYSASDCSVAISRTCSSGVLGGDSTAIYETSAACVLATANASCSSPWINGPDITHGSSVDAFTVSSVVSGSTCPTAVTRTCNAGTLSGDITAEFQSCTEDAGVFYSITVLPGSGGPGGIVAITSCNGGSCGGLLPSTYILAVELANGDQCSNTYTISSSDIVVEASKATGQQTACTLVQQ